MTRRQQDLRQGHEYVLDRLSSYIDRQLNVKERDRVETHLRSCPSCREELQTLQWTKGLLQQVPAVPVPRSFVIRESDLAPQRATSAHRRPGARRPAFALQWATALVAILLVVVVAGDILLGGRQALSRSQPEIAMLSAETPKVVATVVVESEDVEEAPVAAAVEEREQNVEAPAGTPRRLMAPPPTNVPSPAAQAVEQVDSLQGNAPVTGTTAPPPMMLKGAPTEGTPPDKDAQAGDEGYALSKSVTPESPAETETEQLRALDAETAPPPDVQAPEPIEETPMAMALPPVAQEGDSPDTPTTIEPAGRGMRSSLRARWMSSGWRLAEVGLGLLLAGLIVAVLWVRHKN